jgi:hypothetical protein
MLYLALEISTAFAFAYIHSFPHVWCKGLVFVLHASCVTETGRQTRYCRFVCLAQENREIYPYTHTGSLCKKEVPGSVLQ